MAQVNNQLTKSFDFFVEKENANSKFTLDELKSATGWSISTLRTYLSKKWRQYLTKEESDNQSFRVSGIIQYSLEEYMRQMSQVEKNYLNPKKPRNEENTEQLIIKARESALLALEIINRPSSTFKSEGFIVIMIIAWTSLMHAIFEKKKEEYFYKSDDGDFIIVDADRKAWELKECLKQYYGKGANSIVENLMFLIGLRNKIEHRYLPTIDTQIFGECQASILNFDDLMTNEFGVYYAIKEVISFPLQTSNIRTDKQLEIQKRFQGKQYKIVKDYIDNYREGVTSEPEFDVRTAFEAPEERYIFSEG